MNPTGKKGESAACLYLVSRGYSILQRNFSCRFGEVDIIARRNRFLVFCEVKTRSPGALVGAAESVTPAKRRRVTLAAESYLAACDTTGLQPRFDIIAVEKRGPLYFVTEHIEDAF